MNVEAGSSSATPAVAPPERPVITAGLGGDDDKSYDDVTAVPRDRDSDDDMSRVLLKIEDRIDALEREITKVGPLVIERERLLRARSELLGEPLPPHGTVIGVGPARRVRRSDVVAALRSHPGSKAGEIARQLEVGQPAVSAHLYRGKGSSSSVAVGGGISPARGDSHRPPK